MRLLRCRPPSASLPYISAPAPHPGLVLATVVERISGKWVKVPSFQAAALASIASNHKPRQPVTTPQALAVDGVACCVPAHVGRYRRSRYSADMSGRDILPFSSLAGPGTHLPQSGRSPARTTPRVPSCSRYTDDADR